MSKKVLIISSSFRLQSNSDILAHEAQRGALDAGNDVEFVNLKGKNINPCLGCMACQKTLRCVQNDDMSKLISKVRNADVLIFATPIYFYEMCGQLKMFLDRCYPLYPGDYNFRDVYIITTSRAAATHTSDTATMGLLGWITCFEKANLAGMVIGAGVNNPNEIMEHPDLLQQAYEIGQNL
ncbi:MAG: flavodoxin family protein [Alphaproteobacteria bacterium]|nr:flavodoxin family protein [Alphaproteobacteria bacterium]